MSDFGARRGSLGRAGRSQRPAASRFAPLAAIAVLLSGAAPLLGGCQQAPPDARTREAQRQSRLDSLLGTGLELYGSAEYALAARRFRDAAHLAASLGNAETERGATTAECVAWLRVRRLAELSHCSERLERLQRRRSTSDPGVNTLIALGAIAGGRPLPALKIPNAIAPLIRESAVEAAPEKEAM